MQGGGEFSEIQISGESTKKVVVRPYAVEEFEAGSELAPAGLGRTRTTWRTTSITF